MSAATVTRMTKDWQDEAAALNRRSLKDTDFVYVWVDGIHLKVRLEQDKVCLLKEPVALDDGHRESTESWLDLHRSCKRRGMRLRCSQPTTARPSSGPCCAMCSPTPTTSGAGSKIANVLNALPKSTQPGAKAALAEIWNAENREHAQAAAKAFVADYCT
ncbi:hypothetical protein GGD62_008216 [Bradyrhizobium sp. ERR14]|nr:hypothetical protein [Bradyrhizobium sp. ERR14]